MMSSAERGGSQVIRAVRIENFRCYKRLEMDGCEPLNVIVGDNGGGKTALLEAIFLPLATGTEVAMRLRAQRGIDPNFSGVAARIEEALLSDFFHNYDTDTPVHITLKGTGEDTRSLTIAKVGPRIVVQPPSGASEARPVVTGPIAFSWADAAGNSRLARIQVGPAGIQLPDTGEDLPQFFHVPAHMMVGSAENAGRFSDLSMAERHAAFVETVRAQYPEILDLNIEVRAGSPVLYATLEGGGRKVSLANLSGGINRIISVMLAAAHRPGAVICVDEIENGIYYTRHESVARMLLEFVRKHGCQFFITTHSIEWINGLVAAAGENLGDIALWRVERGDDGQPEVFRFSGASFKAGIEQGVEVRGGAED